MIKQCVEFNLIIFGTVNYNDVMKTIKEFSSTANKHFNK